MRRIFKYRLSISADVNIVRGPIIKPLTVEIQHNTPCLWAVVDARLPDREFEVSCVMTGQDMSDVPTDGYLNTILSEDGRFVTHWFCSETQEGA